MIFLALVATAYFFLVAGLIELPAFLALGGFSLPLTLLPVGILTKTRDLVSNSLVVEESNWVYCPQNSH